MVGHRPGVDIRKVQISKGTESVKKAKKDISQGDREERKVSPIIRKKIVFWTDSRRDANMSAEQDTERQSDER